MSFAQTLQRLMDRDGLTNYQLAKALECHQTSVKNWLGGSKPQKLMLKKIADYFGVTTDYLLTGEQKEKPAAESSELDKQLEGINFALWGEVQELTDAQKRDVLKFARFLKEQAKEE